MIGTRIARHGWAALIAGGLLAGCGGKPVAPATTASGPTTVAPGPAASGPTPGPAAHASDPRCDAVRPKIEQLYRTEAQAREPKRVNEAVADNTTMVLHDCVRAPAQIAACIQAAATTQELEAKCLVPLDDEGTEGEQATR